MELKVRCAWCNLKNPKYVEYHDKEWGVKSTDEQYLYEMFILECFQAGLSWECVLNKRDAFAKAYDGFNINKVCAYNEQQINRLLNDKGIIRNKQKIKASVENSRIYKNITEQYGSFYGYLTSFTEKDVIYQTGKTTNWLSDAVSSDLKKRGMRFVGSVTVYSYLQAIGFIYSHDPECYLYKEDRPSYEE